MRTDRRELLAVGLFGPRSRVGARIETLLQRGRAFSPRVSLAAVVVGAAFLCGLVVAGSFAPRWIAFADTTPRLTYEVASIKRNVSGEQGDMHTGPPDADGFEARNFTLNMLLKLAYELKDSQIVGGPSWTHTDRYDVDAKLPDGPRSADRSRLMLRSLLEDRFHLKLRHETKAIPVYVLTGKPRTPEGSPGGCTAAVPAWRGSEPPPIPCAGFVTGPNLIESGNFSMAEFVDVLGNFLDRPVVDRTGFAGRLSVRLDFSSEGSIQGGNTDSSLPSIFTAVQERLGLKLEARKSPAEVLIIDHAERPDAN